MTAVREPAAGSRMLRRGGTVTPRHVRALRGVAAAWVATIVAGTAHTLAGGGAPSPAMVAAVGILAAPFAVARRGVQPERRQMPRFRSDAQAPAALALAAAATWRRCCSLSAVMPLGKNLSRGLDRGRRGSG